MSNELVLFLFHVCSQLFHVVAPQGCPGHSQSVPGWAVIPPQLHWGQDPNVKHISSIKSSFPAPLFDSIAMFNPNMFPHLPQQRPFLVCFSPSSVFHFTQEHPALCAPQSPQYEMIVAVCQAKISKILMLYPPLLFLP